VPNVHWALPDSVHETEQSCPHNARYDPEFCGQPKQDQYKRENADELKKKLQESALFSTRLFRLLRHLMKSPESAFVGLAGSVCAAPIF
jgi:hypothetical protein